MPFKSKGTRPSKQLLFASFVFGAMTVLAACDASAPQDDPAPQTNSIRSVKLHTIAGSDATRRISLPAVIAANKSSELAFKISGKVEFLGPEKGETVNAGTVIAKLDSVDIEKQLEQAKTKLSLAKDAFNRAEKLVGEGAISKAVHEQRKSQMVLAETDVRIAQDRLGDTYLKAPFTGVIAKRHVDPFENVSPLQPVFTLQSQGLTRAVVEVPGSLISGAGDSLSLNAEITIDGQRDIRLPAEFHSVSTQADPETLTFRAEFSFESPEGMLILPGMTATLNVNWQTTLIDDDMGITPLVPLSAVTLQDGQTIVWIFDGETKTVQPRNIQTGKGGGPYLPVESGLNVGDVVVTSGLSLLHKGMRVQPYERN